MLVRNPARRDAFSSRIVAAAAFFCVALFASVVDAATLRLSPASVSARVGESVTILVYVSSTEQAMNAASATILFPSDLLQASAVSKASSILSYWTAEPTFSNGNGSVSFEGIAFNPGFTGSNGRIMSVTLRAIAPGTASLTFADPSVLANDGLATKILTGATGATITINGAPVEDVADVPAEPARQSAGKAVRISSPTHPSSDTWYAAEKGTFAWANPAETSAVRILYDQRPYAEPTIVYSPAISSKDIDLFEGTGYVHVQVRTPDGWNQAAHFAVRVDATPPTPVRVSFPMGTTTETRLLPVIFESTDALSGIDRYDIVVDGKVAATASAGEAGKPFYVPLKRSGSLSIVAVDRAGNSATSESESIIFTGSTSLFSVGYVIALLLTILILLAVGILYTLLTTRAHHVARGSRRAHLQLHEQFDEMKDLVAEAMRGLNEVHSHQQLAYQKERIINRIKRIIDKYATAIERELDDK